MSTFAPKTPKEVQKDEEMDDEERKAVEAKKRHASAVVKQKKASGKTPMTRTQLALKRFIVERVLGDPEILATYTQGRKCKVPSGKFGKMYKDELRKASLNRVLLLVSFLDKGRTNNVLERTPCLFKAGNTEVKSTKDLLNALCRDFLSGEGNLVKHLSNLGVTVGYQQRFIDEYDFSVSNLAVDLRDGVRLVRMTEILTKNDERR